MGVSPSIEPGVIATTPGSNVGADLILASRGNTATTLTLDVDASNGLTASGLPTAESLLPGETRTVPFTVEVDPNVPAGASSTVTVVADLCETDPNCTLPLPSERFARLS